MVDLAGLQACLVLERVEEGVLTGSNLDIGYHRVFGGQILAQILTAAARAVPEKSVRSMQVTFPREGDAGRPLRYRTIIHHQGRTFATGSVHGFQVDESGGERIVAVALISFHTAEQGLHHSVGAPDVGGVDDAAERTIDLIPWEVRVVGGVELGDRGAGPPTFEWWMRATELEGAEDGVIHQALVAHATDLTIIGTALRPMDGLSERDSMTKITTAVTSHSLWFHQPFRLDRWLLVAQDAPIVAHGRAFGRGDIWSGDELVASFAQESMIRPISGA